MTTPIFDPGVPERFSDALATSQPEILNNFISLYQAFLKNHVPISDTGEGNHTIIELLEKEAGPQVDFNEISFYCKNVEGQTDQVFVRFSNNGTEFQLTNYQIYSLQKPTNQDAYFTFLPGKLLVYFGYFLTLPNNILNLNPPIAKNIISVDVCPVIFSPFTPAATDKPIVNLIKNTDGIINQLTFINNNLNKLGSTAPPSCYYMVVANI